MNYFITGIGTNVGKTIVSAVLTEALQADYWKPVQSGTIEGFDSLTVKSLITNSTSVFHPEAYLLKQPLSPHSAAKIEGVEIALQQIQLPKTTNHLIIEGAGGLLVPINETHFVIDMARHFHSEIILVLTDYLGCINHSLLSIDYLLRNQFNIHVLVFNGTFNEEVKRTIIAHAPGIKTLSVNTLQTLSKEEILAEAGKLRAQLKGL